MSRRNQGQQLSSKGRQEKLKAGHKRKEPEKEVEDNVNEELEEGQLLELNEEPRARALKIPRNQKLIVARDATPIDIFNPVETNLMVFGAPSGSERHATMNFYIQKDPADTSIHQPIVIEMKSERALQFGVARFKGEGAYLMVVPLHSPCQTACGEDDLILRRLQEVEDEVKCYLISPDAADFWQQVNIRQPESLAELEKHWSSCINHWTTKVTHQPRTDIRLKFYVDFQHNAHYTAKDYRNMNGTPTPANLSQIPPKTMVKGTFNFKDVFLRPVDTNNKKYPYNVGLTLYAKDVGFYNNPEEQVVLV